MHSVFDKVLQTNKGEKHARECESDFNVQEIYEKLVDFCTKSTKARVNAADILSYVTLDRLESQKGATESFILNQQGQIRLCESLAKTDCNLPNDLKKSLLENTVLLNSYLRVVKDQSEQAHTHQGVELDYDQYSNLTLSASGNYDAQFIPLNLKVSRKACNSEICDNNFYEDSPTEVTEECNFHADSPASLLFANMTETNSSFLPPEDFKCLAHEHR